MTITVLVENTSLSPSLTEEHGLSVLVQTEGVNILIDSGQTDAIIHNSAVLGVDLKAVDYLILSHGHYDHCGGVMSFAQLNGSADIIIADEAFDEYWNTVSGRYIGVDKRIASLPKLHKISSSCSLTDNIELFGSVSGTKLFPFGNKKLQVKGETGFAPDSFSHERYTVITENGKKYLFSGCAHKGVVNIVEEFELLYGEAPHAVVSGFHLMKDSEYTPEEINLISQTAEELRRYPTRFYTGHCTGSAFDIMKRIMGDKLTEIHTGMKIQIN